MTNEELALYINAGDTDLLPVLWGQVQKFITRRAWAYLGTLPDLAQAQTTVEDLVQQGFFGFLRAVQNFDPERGNFLTILNLELKTSFADAAGVRRKRHDPLRTSVSLDEPLSDDEDGGTLGDTIADENAVDPEATSLDTGYTIQLSELMKQALDRLPERKRTILNELYYQHKPLSEVADELGVSSQAVAEARRTAFAELRSGKYGRILREFYELRR